MNDPLHDPLGEDPLGDHSEFEVKEEPFEFYDDSVCWVSEGVTIIENGEDEYKNHEEAGRMSDQDCLSGSSERTTDTQGDLPDMCQSYKEAEGNCSVNGRILPAKGSILHKKKIKRYSSDLDMKRYSTDVDVKRVTKEKPMLKKKEGKFYCDVKKEIVYHVKEERQYQVKKESEGKYKRDLERQLASYRSNIKRMQKILDEERAKMTKVQNALINLRRRLRRRELKMMKTNTTKIEIKEEREEMEEEDLKKKEMEMEVKGQIILDETLNKKRKELDKIPKIRIKKLKLPKSFEIKNEIILKEQEIEIKKTIKKGVIQEKKREKIEQPKELKQKKKLDELKKKEDVKGVKKDDEQKKMEVEQTKVETEEKNVKPEIQIATSHMLWNVLSRIKSESYSTNPIDNSNDVLQETDVNLTLHPHNKPNTSDVPLLVKEFMLRDDVSKACSPSDLDEAIPEARYRMYYLLILHKQFVAEYGLLCNYKTFANYVPKNVLKPSPRFWKTCTCFPCLNPELKFENLNSQGLLNMSGMELADILQDSEMENTLMTQLRKLRESRDILPYDAWEKTCSGTIHSKRRIVSEPVGIVVAKFFEELSLLKAHIQKTFCQLDAAKLARERAMHSTDEVTLHLDCSPIPIYRHPESESASSDIATILTVLTGYLWTEGGFQTVIAMSDSKDYTTAAVWAGLEKILLKVIQAGKSKINIISDCPTNRYRNKSNFYFMSDFAQTFGVCFRWVFLELGHGIGHAGIVRADFDRVIRDQISNNSIKPVKNSCDVLSLVHTHTSSAVHTYTDQDVKKYKFLLPKLRVVQGTQKFHEVIILPEDFWVRDVVSHDAFRKLSI